MGIDECKSVIKYSKLMEEPFETLTLLNETFRGPKYTKLLQVLWLIAGTIPKGRERYYFRRTLPHWAIMAIRGVTTANQVKAAKPTL